MTLRAGKHIYLLLVLLSLAVIARIDYNTWQGIRFYGDTESYIRVAESIMIDGSTFDPHRTPVYPLFLVCNYLLFGYGNNIAVGIIQAILGTLSVILIYLLTYTISRSRTASMLAGISIAFNYNIMHYDMMIVTEALAGFLVIIAFWSLYWLIKSGISLIPAIIFSFLVLILIFLRPAMMLLVPFAMIIALAHYLRNKEFRKCIRMLLPFCVIVLLPLLMWSITMKSRYGFWSISNVQYVNILRVIIRNDMVDDAPEKYSALVAEINKELERQDDREKYNTTRMLEDIDTVIPKGSDEDYSYLSAFARDTALGKPFKFIRRSLSFLPKILDDTLQEKEYSMSNSLVARAGYFIYKTMVYRPMIKNVIPVLLILLTVFLAVKGYSDKSPRIFFMLLTTAYIWMTLAMNVIFACSDFDRLRMPIDAMIIMVVWTSIAILFKIFDKRFRHKYNPAAGASDENC